MTVSRLRDIPLASASTVWPIEQFALATAATPMTDWGPQVVDYLRLVFASEPLHRLRDIGDRFRRALG